MSGSDRTEALVKKYLSVSFHVELRLESKRDGGRTCIIKA